MKSKENYCFYNLDNCLNLPHNKLNNLNHKEYMCLKNYRIPQFCNLYNHLNFLNYKFNNYYGKVYICQNYYRILKNCIYNHSGFLIYKLNNLNHRGDKDLLNLCNILMNYMQYKLLALQNYIMSNFYHTSNILP